ncbi:NUDIX domain-containing protein [Chengkuizengella sp. SCS-71B]|uniref:NUDIX domain-containing protein n=1 Tax=Chengkuizengella sp. SCS-71B TaxID=3115290 RepID=UPI0032C24271
MINGDITLDILNGKFSCRVGAIIIDSNEILMAKDEKTSFYYTIGGRVRFGETAEEAILREIFEETQHRLELGELKYVHENFFTSYEGTVNHEISFFTRLNQVPNYAL